jgi:TRAP-type C4-dicarboxylate transport system substrate-binding protein
MYRRSFLRNAGATAAATAALAYAPLRAGAAQYSVTVGTSGGPPVPSEVAIDNWARDVETRSQGQISVHVVHHGQLGNEQQLLRSTQSNAIQMGASSNANLDSFTPAMQVFELPFLFRNASSYFRAWESPTGQTIKAQVEKSLGIKILMVLDAGGFRSILTRRKPIRLPSDLAGQKLRIAKTPVELATFKHFGVDPVSAANSEIFTMLEQGTIDGVVLQPPWIFADRLQETAKYYCDIRYVMYAYLLYIGSGFFNGLPKNLQDILATAAEEEQAKERSVAARSVDAALVGIAKAGVEMHTPTAAEEQAWVQSTRFIWSQFEPKIGRSVIQAMQKI